MIKIKYLFIILLGLVFLSNLSFADIHMANGTGGSPCNFTAAATNHTTIQAAINAASNGDTVLVCANGTGGYRENVIINKTINLYGNQSGVNVTAINSSMDVFKVNATYVNITNFTLSGATGDYKVGLHFNSTSTHCYVYNTTSHNNYYGFYVREAHNHTFINNTAYNGTYGFYLSLSNNNSLSNNIAYNHTMGFEVRSSSLNILSNNTAYNNAHYGFRLFTNSNNNNLSSNNAYGNLLQGFIITVTSHNNTISSNNIYNNSNGIYVLWGSNDNTFTNNTIYLDTSSSFYAIDSEGIKLYNNTIYDISKGLYCPLNCTISAFEGNNITNATTYAIHLADSPNSFNFSGNNGIYNTPSASYELYLDNSTISTGIYNITTYNLTFGLNTTYNVSIKTANLSSLSLTTVTSISGIAISSGKVVKNPNSNYYGLTVTNLSATATFAPRLYYDHTDLATYSTNYLGIGSTSTAGSWTYYDPTTRDTTVHSLYKTGITSFSYFAPIVYNPYVDGGGDDTPSPSDVDVTHTFNCTTGEVVVNVTSEGSAASGVTATLMGVSHAYSSSGDTDGAGQVNFTITSDGIYRILTAATSEYHAGSESDFELELCEEETRSEVDISHVSNCTNSTWEMVITVTSEGSYAEEVPVTLVGVSPGLDYDASGVTDEDGEVLFTMDAAGIYRVSTDETENYLANSGYKITLTNCSGVPVDLCFDSDGGIEIFTPGNVTSSPPYFAAYDACVADNRIMEKYCDGVIPQNETIDCPEGYVSTGPQESCVVTDSTLESAYCAPFDCGCWEVTYDDPDTIVKMSIDSNSNIYVVMTNHTASYNFRISKRDECGQEVWTTSTPAFNPFWSSPAFMDMDIDKTRGYLYMTSSTYVSGVGYRILLYKYSTSTGSSLWSEPVYYYRNDSSYTRGHSEAVSVDQATGNIYVAGTVLRSSILLAYNSSGELLWNRTYDDNCSIANVAEMIVVNGADEGIYMTGSSRSSCSMSGSRALVAKYDLEGNLIWEQDSDSHPLSISYDPANSNLYVGAIHVYYPDLMSEIEIYNTSGSFIADYNLPDMLINYSIVKDNHIYVVGSTTLNLYENGEMVVKKLHVDSSAHTPTITEVWSDSFGEEYFDIGVSVAADDLDNVYAAGFVTTSVYYSGYPRERESFVKKYLPASPACDAMDHAEEAITDAEAAIEEAMALAEEGAFSAEDVLSIADAQALLDEAQEAYDDRDYDRAEELAQEAIELMDELLAPPEEAPEGLGEVEVEEEEQLEDDYSWAIYLVGIVIILAIVYFVVKKNK